ncbi:MAG: NUDIX hydrolase [Acidimicrobiia bacterium]
MSIANPHIPICGVGALVRSEDRFLLIKRARPPQAGMWAVPGGKVEWGESLREAVIREVAEETGLAVEVGKPIWVGERIGPGEPAEWHICLVDFDAFAVGGELAPGDDAAEVGWFTHSEALKLALTPTMRSMFESIDDR